MAYITKTTKKCVCPIWNEPITIHAEYLYLREEPTKAKFLSAYCPIRENLNKPISNRNPLYEPFTYCDNTDCPLLNDFPAFIQS